MTEKHRVHSNFWPADCELILQKKKKSTRVKKQEEMLNQIKSVDQYQTRRKHVFKNDIFVLSRTRSSLSSNLTFNQCHSICDLNLLSLCCWNAIRDKSRFIRFSSARRNVSGRKSLQVYSCSLCCSQPPLPCCFVL